MTAVVLPFPGNEALARGLAKEIGVPVATVEVRPFPDGESYVRILGDVAGHAAVVVCSLDRPDEKTLPLLFLAAAARDLGARSVGLVAPYLAYMRQDCRFLPGEAVTSVTYARLVAGAFDWMVTVDPHLHRVLRLGAIYPIPCATRYAVRPIREWIGAHVERPALLGPDAESGCRIWRLARLLDVPWRVLSKTRRGDRDVSVSGEVLPGDWHGRTVVIVDDVASTGQTLVAAVDRVVASGLAGPTCVVVHPLFADHAVDDVLRAGAERVVSCDTVPHWTNAISVLSTLVDPVRRYVDAPPETRRHERRRAEGHAAPRSEAAATGVEPEVRGRMPP